jgi:YHS domain-containing protein/positive regulator of sigma E activity
MARVQGTIINTTPDGWAEVMTERGGEACMVCSGSHCCESLLPGGKTVTRALNRAAAHTGDLVSLNSGAKTVAKGAALLYMLPVGGIIAGLVAGAGLGRVPFLSESGSSMLFGFVGLAMGFAAMTLISRLKPARDAFEPVITGILMRKADSNLARRAVDPVCNMTVDPDKAPASYHYGDQTYYFCHPGCKEAFMKEPGKYLTSSG